MFNRAASLLPALAACSALCAGGPAVARVRSPVVVELYTSQGCSACLAADDIPAKLDGRPGVLALTFPVDYWDYLGWRDTFAQPGFTDRQKAYAKALGLREVYTPEVIVDGSAEAGRAKAGESLDQAVEGLVRKAAKTRRTGPAIRLRHGKVEIGPGAAPKGGAEVWLVRYEASPAEVEVKTGENAGKTVRYHNVARELDRLGTWTGRARAFAEPQPSAGGLKAAVLVQAKDGGHLLAAFAP